MGTPRSDLNKYIEDKLISIKQDDEVIEVLGLIDNELIGFISLFKEDNNERI